MKKLILLGLLFSFNCSAKDDDITLHTGMISHHFGVPKDKSEERFNERHDLVAIEYQYYILGTFLNSHYDRTFFIGENVWLDEHEHGFSTGYTWGMSHGYRYGANNTKKFMPVFLPKIRYKYDRYSLNLGYMFIENVVTLSFSVDL